MTARERLVLDVGLMGALLVAANPAMTGLALHEWIGIAAIVPLFAHLVVNWEWTARTARTFVDKALNASRVNLVVDAALFVSTVAVMLSGAMVSRVALGAIGLATTPSALWSAVHSVSADATLVLLLTHFALHAAWFARVAGRWLEQDDRPAPAAAR